MNWFQILFGSLLSLFVVLYRIYRHVSEKREKRINKLFDKLKAVFIAYDCDEEQKRKTKEELDCSLRSTIENRFKERLRDFEALSFKGWLTDMRKKDNYIKFKGLYNEYIDAKSIKYFIPSFLKRQNI